MNESKDTKPLEKITVVIVDSGVKTNSPLFKDDIFEGFTIKGGERKEGFQDEYGHGTAVYNILRKEERIRIINIKLDNVENGIKEIDLISTLEYIERNIFCNIINLSLGLSICYEYERLKRVCDLIEKKGIIMVSSFDNFGSMSYPAAFKSVIGVTAGECCNKISDFEYYDDDIVNIGAKSSIQRVAWSEPEYLFIGGNSFACVHITHFIASLMLEGIYEKKQILEELKSKAIVVQNHKSKNKKKVNMFSIKKAALFPFNKEMHSLVRFKDMLTFSISNIYDVKYSGFVGSTTDHILKDHTIPSMKIENIDAIDWEQIDTLIIGHVEHLLRNINHSTLLQELLNQAVEHEKYVFCFDDVSRYVNDRNQKFIRYPAVNEYDLPWDHCGKLYRYSKPILGIFGTSSQQGKFTLQLALRKLFLEEGYNIGQIGTEPSALLFGMDYVFPMGYNSSVYIQDFDVILYLNDIVNQLCQKGKDIIIAGSQSGSITYDMGNLQQYSIHQYQFLLGIQPEAIILCVNPYDEIKYLERTIMFLESSIDTKVIAIVVFPKDIKSDWKGMYGTKELMTEDKYNQFKEQLKKRFDKPVFRLGDEEDIRKLFEEVVNYFSEE